MNTPVEILQEDAGDEHAFGLISQSGHVTANESLVRKQKKILFMSLLFPVYFSILLLLLLTKNLVGMQKKMLKSRLPLTSTWRLLR